MHVVECAAAETRDQAPSRTTAMFAWDPYAAFFLGGGDDVEGLTCDNRVILHLLCCQLSRSPLVSRAGGRRLKCDR